MWELPNRSEYPRDSTHIHVEDIRIQLDEWLATDGIVYADEIVIWHTHPAGHVGPSRHDLDQAVPGVLYLVVALTGEDYIPVWYRSRDSLVKSMGLKEVRDDGSN